MLDYLIRRPKWIVVAIGILIFWLTQTEWLTDSYLWQKSEGILIDRRYEVRGPQVPNPDIVLIGLNTTTFQLDALSTNEIASSTTLQKMQHPWPWSRSVYADILEKLIDAGAKVVMFDFVFTSEGEDDDVFGKALQKYKDHVVIGELFADDEGLIDSSYNSITKKLNGPIPDLLLPGTETVPNLVTLWPDPDGVERRLRYQTSVSRETSEMPTIDPRIINSLKKQIKEGKIPDDLNHITTAAALKFEGKVKVPPPDPRIFVDYQGDKKTYIAWPVENMFVDALWQMPPFKNGLAISNKIVIVGPMAEIFHDLHMTPFGEVPGPVMQAQFLSALLDGKWLNESSRTTNLCLTLGAVVLGLFICLAIPQALLKGGLLVVSTVAFLIGSQIAFTYGNDVVEMVPPLFCLIGTSSFGIIFEYTLEQVERRRYRNILNRYVSRNVAKVILADRRSLEESMRGVKKPVTILFSDIRSFTTMTEQSDPDKLVAQLNEYFQEMVSIIQDKSQGTLQKFIGDAIMAAWGDTHTSGIEEDARRGVSAALAMRPALAQLNKSWKDNPDRKVFATGIGVNHGDVVTGNVGSRDRTEFTVLGDGVNLAARLESATKQFHTDILIGEMAEKLTRGHFIYRAVDLMIVKGKNKPVEVFALLSDSTVPPPAWLESYHAAVKMYRTREFKEAIDRFRFVQEQISGGDYLCEMYLERCQAYQANPPPENWDGSYTLSEK